MGKSISFESDEFLAIVRILHVHMTLVSAENLEVWIWLSH